ncbi:hypothetical protein D3C84_364010 [compost metagenome]
MKTPLQSKLKGKSMEGEKIPRGIPKECSCEKRHSCSVRFAPPLISVQVNAAAIAG